MQCFMSLFIGLLVSVSVSAEPLLEGQVRLESGDPATGVQVRLFDLTNLHQSVGTTTDETGHFALSLPAAAPGSALPQGFALGQNYPNPFNPATIIPYQIPAAAHVRLEVFNVLGQRLATLVDAEQAAGAHTATWTATDETGRAVGAGVYIYRLSSGSATVSRRMVLIDGQAGTPAAGAASVLPGGSGDGAGEQTYGLVVAGPSIAPYVVRDFRVEAGMAPVEVVVEVHPAGKALGDDLSDLFDLFNTQQEEAEETEPDSTSNNATSGPDLIVQSPSVSDSTLTPGQAFTLSATVQNQGDEQTAATMLHYYRSNNSTITSSDTEVGTDAIDALDASASSAASIALTAPTGVSPEVGIYYGACVASVSGESNTDNNCSTGVRVIVAEDEDDARGDHTPTDSVQDDALSSPPPTWVFAGDVPAADRTELREEMEAVRAFFAEQYGVEATNFTVLVSANYEALAPVFRDVIGIDMSSFTAPAGHSPPDSATPNPFVTVANDDRSVMVLNYQRNPLSVLRNAIAHEYFHVLQHHLAPNWLSDGPYWLVEGSAEYADYIYSQTKVGRRPFLGDNGRSSPYEDVNDAVNLKGIMTPSTLEWLDTQSNFRASCGEGESFSPYYTYSMAFLGTLLASEQGNEDSYVQYWKLLYDHLGTKAFEEAFGIGLDDFYQTFEEWLPLQLPSEVQLLVRLHWPGKEVRSDGSISRFEFHLGVAPDSAGGFSWGGMTDGGHTIVYPAGTSLTGYLRLDWRSYDQCTDHILGWYKEDGGLTDQRTEATPVEFTGTSSSLEWTLPVDPSTLPSLSQRSTGLCTP